MYNIICYLLITNLFYMKKDSLYMNVLPESDPLHKVTIIPRGRALGGTMQLPEKDKYSQSMTYLKSRLSILFAGRLAEEMIFGKEKVCQRDYLRLDRYGQIWYNNEAIYWHTEP